MAARLPDVTDYGGSVSLRSDRIDRPDESGLMLAEALERATANVADAFEKRKEKKDRLNYALAKNELLKADIESRKGLDDREDYENFDDSYQTTYRDREQQIFQKYGIAAEDRELLSSESELIVTRGRVYAGDLSRQKRIEFKQGQIESNLNDALEEIQAAPPELANDLMLQQLENIQSAIDIGIYKDPEGQTLLRTFVRNAATDSINGMTTEEQVAVLEASIAAREKDGPLTPDDIAAGKGSGTIADFLHEADVKRMLKVAKEANSLENELGQAQAILDDVESRVGKGNPEAIIEGVRSATKGADPKTRARAEELARLRANELKSLEASVVSDNFDLLASQLANGVEYHNLDPRTLVSLPVPLQEQLKGVYRGVQESKPFGLYDNMVDAEFTETEGGGMVLVKPSYKYWADMTPEQKVEVKLESEIWRRAFTKGRWESMVNEQKILNNSTGAAGEKSIQTLDQIVTDVWTGDMKMPRTGRDKNTDSLFYEMRGRVASEVDRVSDEKYGGKQPPDSVEREIARNIIGQLVWKRDVELFWKDSKEPVRGGSIDPKDARFYFVPIDRWRNRQFPLAIGEEGVRKDITWEQYLINRASALPGGAKPNDRDKENAYAQFVLYQMGHFGIDEMNERMDAALRGEYEY